MGAVVGTSKVGVARVHARPFLRVVGRLSLGKFKWRMLGILPDRIGEYLPQKLTGCRLTGYH